MHLNFQTSVQKTQYPYWILNVENSSFFMKLMKIMKLGPETSTGGQIPEKIQTFDLYILILLDELHMLYRSSP